jgi:uncharacterized protein YidB (DUF937 family)
MAAYAAGRFSRLTVASSNEWSHAMNNLVLGQILAGVLGRAMGRRGVGAAPALRGRGNTLVALLLPLAMRWVQRNGGVREVLKRFQQKGYTRQAQSWVATGENQDLQPQAVDEVVGQDELARIAHQLGLPQREVAQGFAQILPEMVNQLTPDGQLPDDADDVLEAGRFELEKELGEIEQQDGARA